MFANQLVMVTGKLKRGLVKVYGLLHIIQSPLTLFSFCEANPTSRKGVPISPSDAPTRTSTATREKKSDSATNCRTGLDLAPGTEVGPAWAEGEDECTRKYPHVEIIKMVEQRDLWRRTTRLRKSC